MTALIIFAVKKKPKKKALIACGIGFVLVVVGAPSVDNTEDAAEPPKEVEQVTEPVQEKEVEKPNEDTADVEDKEDTDTTSETTKEQSAEPVVENEVAEIEVIDESERIAESIRKQVEDIIRNNYDATVIKDITVNENLGTDEEGDYIVLAYLSFDRKNSKKMSREMTLMYSSDLGARMADVPEVYELTVFWEVPYHSNNGNVAKFNLQRNAQGMYFAEEWYDPFLSD